MAAATIGVLLQNDATRQAGKMSSRSRRARIRKTMRTSLAAAARRLVQACLTLPGVLLVVIGASHAMAQTSQPRTVSFASADGKTTLVGYLFAPAGRPKTAPAVVLMHGAAGAYAPTAKGNYSAVTLEKRIRSWAEIWAAQGYWALVVDSFGPRGYPAGMLSGASRTALSPEAAIRPLDAYGALRYLRSSPRVRSDRIGLEGWANGGSAALYSMGRTGPLAGAAEPGPGFRLAIAIYPGCSLEGEPKTGYLPYAPVHIFIGSRDERVSVTSCERLAAASKTIGGQVSLTILEGATHDFDDPVKPRADVPANAAATAVTRREAVALMAAALR
jgi:carboxymethylenebutenolidase